MSKYSEMTDEQYFAAQDKFFERYHAPRSKPIEMLDLVLSREEADEIIKGERKVVVRPFSYSYFHYLTDHFVDEWMTEHRDSFGMDMEAFKEFMCATRPVTKIHFHDKNNTWFLDVTCIENALIWLTLENVRDLNRRYNCKDLNRQVIMVENLDSSDEWPMFYYFALGHILQTEQNRRAAIIPLKTAKEIK